MTGKARQERQRKGCRILGMGSRMKEKKNRKTYMLAAALVVLLAAGGLVSVLLRGHSFADQNPNLALGKGVKATADSVEQDSLSAQMAIDGNDSDRASRWSSENNREDASHYIRLEFPAEISVSFVVLKWERANVISYALEGSADGAAYETLASFDTAPETLTQEIVLENPVSVRFLRLSTDVVSKEETDFSNLYQNVSLYEFEVYADKPTAYKLKTPVIEKTAKGRRLVMPETPDGFEVTLIGADLEQVIGADGTVYDNIQDKDVTVGYRVEDKSGREETREVSFVVKVPVADAVSDVESDCGETEKSEIGGAHTDDGIDWAQDKVFGRNACPDWVIPSIAEWRGGRGSFTLKKDSRIIVGTDSRPPKKGERKGVNGVMSSLAAAADMTESADQTARADKQALWDVAALLEERCYKDKKWKTHLTICKGAEEDLRAGDIYLGYAEKENGLGKEGYTCTITDRCVIKAEEAAGVRWGTVTLLQIMLLYDSKFNAPQGQIRDYPLYEVRGMGIDVARKAVSLDALYAMMEAMSWYKMNDLTIHLNDNEILATSGLTGSAGQAMTAESAFRLESDVLGVQAGEGAATPQEYAYSKEEFAQFIAAAKTYGVTVVPEIDTPAHSLAITKRYPEYALQKGSESVDQLDLANDKAVAFAEKIWQEALHEEKGAFREAEIVNIGMDEYYGDGEQYRQYLNRINDLVQETGKTVRLWGSLSNIGGTTVPSPENLQMNLWSTVWADPMEMYEAGYSLINMQNNHLYIIPGGGYDRLDIKELYENWTPNRFYDYNRIETIPSYSPQMLGAACMIWNDMCGSLDVGISEYDIYERFTESLGVLSCKLWGADRKEASLQASVEDLESLGSPRKQPAAWELLQLDLINAELRRNFTIDKKTYVLYRSRKKLSADNNAVPYRDAEAAKPGFYIRMKVYLEPDARQPQIIAEGDCAYGKWAFYAAEPETGKVGFTREGKTYTFDYTLPRGEWVTLGVSGGSSGPLSGGSSVTLDVGGEAIPYHEVGSVGSSEPFEEHATFAFPLQRVGKQTGSFDGKLEFEVKVGGYGD